MPRRARLAFPNMPHHLTQRGHRRNPVFFSDADRADYLGTLGECRASLGVRVFAYCLMTNHVHLVVDPGDDPAALGRMMQRLASRHTWRLNELHQWSGSIWEGRFHSSPIDTDRYLLACGRYVDQNPVRANLVSRPEDYPWSSYHARAGLAPSSLLDPDPALASLSTHDATRYQAYRDLAGAPLPADELELIREASRRNQLTGDDDFIATIRHELGRDIPPTKPGGQPAHRRQQSGRPKERAPRGALSL